MSAKTYFGDGIFSQTPTRGPRAGQPIFFSGRLWIPSERRFRYFRLGGTLREAKRKLGVLAGDPEKAVTERAKHTAVVRSASCRCLSARAYRPSLTVTRAA